MILRLSPIIAAWCDVCAQLGEDVLRAFHGVFGDETAPHLFVVVPPAIGAGRALHRG